MNKVITLLILTLAVLTGGGCKHDEYIARHYSSDKAIECVPAPRDGLYRLQSFGGGLPKTITVLETTLKQGEPVGFRQLDFADLVAVASDRQIPLFQSDDPNLDRCYLWERKIDAGEQVATTAVIMPGWVILGPPAAARTMWGMRGAK